jgi:hypothetical protein
MTTSRSFASAILAFGMCNAAMGAGLLVTRDVLWVRVARWLASMTDVHLSMLLSLVARGQIALGLVLLVLGVALIRRLSRDAGEHPIETDAH